MAPPDPGPANGEDAAHEEDAVLAAVASELGATIRTRESDGTGWRWRCGWRGIEMGAWNDIDGVAVVADIGPWDEWLGLRGHPPDPSPGAALRWAVEALRPWLAEPDNAERIAARILARRNDGH